MKVSCILGPTVSTPEQIALAEQLGYSCAYVFDSPSLCPDPFMTLALAAQRTNRISLGTGMMVPRLRHVVTTAAAFATLHRLAPGRVVLGVGSGFTASRLLGKPSMRWGDVRIYVEALQALLRNEEVAWDDAVIRFVPSPDFARSLPIELPVLVAADGPKGWQAARALNAGLCAALPGAPRDFDWVAQPIYATVLEDGESHESDRVWDAVGAGVAIGYHATYEFGGAQAVDELPGGADWRLRVEQTPLERRHLSVHEGHAYVANSIDCETIPRQMADSFAMVGSASEVRDAVCELGRSGVTEVIFNANGSDIPGELERFAQAAMNLQTAAV